ncbi:MAG: hypothetical protein ACYSVY_00075 [Planctomycetota bacterium]|jgi:hypothetical protein
MADPRLTAGWDGIGAVYATCKVDASTITYSATSAGGSASVGLAVTWSANAKVIETVADGEFVLGKLIKVEADGIATVQIAGHMTLPAGTTATLTLGKAIVGDLLVAAEGYIREVATATAAELGVQRGFIVDPAVTTAVEVYL